MAVPKRRMSRANTRSRRAQWKAKRPELVNVTVAGQQHKGAAAPAQGRPPRPQLGTLDRRSTGRPRATGGAPLRPVSGDG